MRTFALLLLCATVPLSAQDRIAPKRPAVEPDRPPELSTGDRSLVMGVARGMLNALWTGGNPDDVPGAALRDRNHPVLVTLRRMHPDGGTELLARRQATGTHLLEALREAIAGAVGQAKSKLRHEVAVGDLRLEVELAGDEQPLRWRHQGGGAVGARTLELTPNAFFTLKTDGVPEEVLHKLRGLAGKRFQDEPEMVARLLRLLNAAEFARHRARIVERARPDVPANISGDIVEQCRRGIHGLAVEVPTKKHLVQSRAYPGETIEDNIPNVGFVGRALLGVPGLPDQLSAAELKRLVDKDAIRFRRFRSLQLVETDARGGWRETFRGHGPPTADEIKPERVLSAVDGLSDHLLRLLMVPNRLRYFPSIDQFDNQTELPMERGIIAWAMAEASRRRPEKKHYFEMAVREVGRSAKSIFEERVPAIPEELFLIGKSLKRDAGPTKDAKADELLHVIREADGVKSHLGAVSTAVVAMCRLPQGAYRESFVGDPVDVEGKDGKKVRIMKPRELLLQSIVWMQNRAGVSNAPNLIRPTTDPEAREPIGSFRTWFPPTKQVVGQDLHHGPALYALALYHEERAHPVVAAALRSARVYYSDEFKRRPTTATAVWHIPVWSIAWRKLGDRNCAETVLQMADWLLLQQIDAAGAADPDLAGGFQIDREPRPGAASAGALWALCHAYRTAVDMGDRDRAGKYRNAIRAAVRFVLQLQMTRDDMHYVRRPDLALHGIRLEAADNTLRLVDSAMALIALHEAAEILWPLGR